MFRGWSKAMTSTEIDEDRGVYVLYIKEFGEAKFGYG